MKTIIAIVLVALLAACQAPRPRMETQSVEALEKPQAVLLRGTIVTPQGVVPDGWVTLRGQKIADVSAARPDVPGATVLETADIIFPGFVDLHNHPFYDVLPRWNPPGKPYANRYAWRYSQPYLDAVSAPYRKVFPKEFCAIDAFVKVKALIGGTTSFTGGFPPRDVDSTCMTGLVRNLDYSAGFGNKPGQERMENALGITCFDPNPNGRCDMKAERAQALRDKLAKREIDSLLIHVAEGQRGDSESQGELGQLKAAGLLTDRTGIIHAVAFTKADFDSVAAAGAGIIWSPRSNLELYGQTMDVAAAKSAGVTLAIAPDWSPTGSTNMLAEMRYAYGTPGLGGVFTPKELFDMATSVPARIGRVDDRIGAIRPGLYADLFLLRGDRSDPYRALVTARPQDITLVLVGGAPAYGTAAYLATLKVAAQEAVQVCGQPMALDAGAFAGKTFDAMAAGLKNALDASGSTLGPLVECAEP